MAKQVAYDLVGSFFFDYDNEREESKWKMESHTHN